MADSNIDLTKNFEFKFKVNIHDESEMCLIDFYDVKITLNKTNNSIKINNSLTYTIENIDLKQTSVTFYLNFKNKGEKGKYNIFLRSEEDIMSEKEKISEITITDTNKELYLAINRSYEEAFNGMILEFSLQIL